MNYFWEATEAISVTSCRRVCRFSSQCVFSGGVCVFMYLLYTEYQHSNFTSKVRTYLQSPARPQTLKGRMRWLKVESWNWVFGSS